jgi:ParB-like chromosome segregation protein Spo0J
MTSTGEIIRCDRCKRPLRASRSIAEQIGRGCKAIRRAEALAGFKPEQADRARKLIADGGIAPTTERRVFFAISSDGYTRHITDAGARTCTCPAGEHGRRCYHLAAALWLEAVPVRRVLALAA